MARTNTADNTNTTSAVTDVRAYVGFIDRLNEGFEKMSENGVSEERIFDIKDQLDMGYVNPALRIDSDLKGAVPEGMGMDNREVMLIRNLSSGGVDKNGKPLSNETNLGLGQDFARHLGIDTTRTHYVSHKEESGEFVKTDFKEQLKDNMSPELYSDTKSVYIMQDYSRANRTDFNAEVKSTWNARTGGAFRQGRTENITIPFQDLRITTFVFEKYDGTYDFSASYTNDAGVKLDDVPGVRTEGFNWDGKLQCIDNFTPKVERYGKSDALKEKAENFVSDRITATKENVYKQQIEKTENIKESRQDIEKYYKEGLDAAKGMYNVIAARYDEMSSKLSELKGEIDSARDKCIAAERLGDKAEIDSAKSEYAQKINDYLDTRSTFNEELSKQDMTELKGVLNSFEKSYSNIHEYNDRVYGDGSKDFRKADSELSADNKFHYAISTTRGNLIAESGNNISLNIKEDKFLQAADNGHKYLETKVEEWNDSNPDRKVSLDDDGIVRDGDGKEFLSYIPDGELYDHDTDGFIDIADTDNFELDDPVEAIRERLDDEGLADTSDSYRDSIIKELGSEERLNENIDNAEEDKTDNDDNNDDSKQKVSLFGRLNGVQSEKDLFRADSHINPTGKVELSDKKINEIKDQVLKEFGVDRDKFEARKGELKSGMEMSKPEMDKIKSDTLKDMKGNETVYKRNLDSLSGAAKDKMNMEEIYSRLGVDINKIKSLTVEKVNDIKLSDKQMESIDKQARFEAKGDTLKAESIKTDLIQETKERFAEAQARKELGVDNKQYYTVRDDLRNSTTLPDSVQSRIEVRSRELAGYDEAKYKANFEKNLDAAKDKKAEAVLNKEFGIDTKAYNARYDKLINDAESKLQKAVDKINSIQKNIDKWKDFGPLNRTNLIYNVEKTNLHSAVNEYRDAGGKIGNDCFVKSEYKMIEKFSDALMIYRSNIIETAVYVVLEKIQGAIDHFKDDTDNDRKGGVSNDENDGPSNDDGNEWNDNGTYDFNDPTTPPDDSNDITNEPKDSTGNDDTSNNDVDKPMDSNADSVEPTDSDGQPVAQEDIKPDTENEPISTDDAIKDENPVDNDKESLEPEENNLDNVDNDTDINEEQNRYFIPEDVDESDDVTNEQPQDTETEQQDLEAEQKPDDIENNNDNLDNEQKGLDSEQDNTDTDKESDTDKTDNEPKESEVENEPKEELDKGLEENNEDAEENKVDNTEDLQEQQIEGQTEEPANDDAAAVEDTTDDSAEDTTKDTEKEESAKNDDAAAVQEEQPAENDVEYEDANDVVKSGADNTSEEDSRVYEDDDDGDEEKSAIEKFKEKIEDYLEGKFDSLEDALKDIEPIGSYVDEIETFLDAFENMVESLSTGDAAEFCDSISQMIGARYGDLAGDVAEKIFDSLLNRGISEDVVNSISDEYSKLAAEEVPDLEYAGNVGEAEFTENGSVFDSIEPVDLNTLESESMNGFGTPETMEQVGNDIDISNKIDALSNYINEQIDSGVIEVPEGVDITMADANNIANEMYNSGFVSTDNTTMDFGDYKPDDSTIQDFVNNYDPSQYTTEPETAEPEPMDNVDTGIEQFTPDMIDPSTISEGAEGVEEIAELLL